MPKISDIDNFNDYLNQLGDELNILAQRGEEIGDIVMPREAEKAPAKPENPKPSDPTQKSDDQSEPADKKPLPDPQPSPEPAPPETPAAETQQPEAAEAAADTESREQDTIRPENSGANQTDQETAGKDDLPTEQSLSADLTPGTEGADAPVLNDDSKAESDEEESSAPDSLLPASEDIDLDESESLEPRDDEINPEASVLSDQDQADEDIDFGDIDLGDIDLDADDFAEEDFQKDNLLASVEEEDEEPTIADQDIQENIDDLDFSIEPEPEADSQAEQATESDEQTEQAQPEESSDTALLQEAGIELEDVSVIEADDDEEANEFNITEAKEAFGVDDESKAKTIGEDEPKDFALSQIDASDENLEFPEHEIELIFNNISELPRDLRLDILAQIGEKGLGGRNLRNLIRGLINGDSAVKIAEILNRTTGKKRKLSEIPKKYSGADFILEQKTLLFTIKQSIVPILMPLTASLLLGLLLFYLAYQFIYKPLYARSLYYEGIDQIGQNFYDQGNRTFNEAQSWQPSREWHFDYAEAFVDKKQYRLAEEKYTQLLASYPDDKQGLLAYAILESEILGKYAQAETLIKQVLALERYDSDGLLAQGDNYMRWADDLDPEKYEEARVSYALLIQTYGFQTAYLFRMLSYLIHSEEYNRQLGTENYPEIIQLRQTLENVAADQMNPAIYTELCGYLIENQSITGVEDMLKRALEIAPDLAEIHYQLARYYQEVNNVNQQTVALNHSIAYLEAAQPLNKARLSKLIESYNRQGEILYRQGNFLDAEKSFRAAITLYEDARELSRLPVEAKYGQIYANIGALYYDAGEDYDQAMEFYDQALANNFSKPEMRYHRGFIFYQRRDYANGLAEFDDIFMRHENNPNLQYALAATFYQRNDYYLAEGRYAYLLSQLENRYRSREQLFIDEREEDLILLQNMMKLYNNIGVTLNRLYLATGIPGKNSDSLIYLTRSMEFYDLYTRDLETGVRSDSRNLGFINSQAILYPTEGYSLQIYNEIPRNLTDSRF